MIRLRCWWWRIWTFRKEKFKITMYPPNYFDVGDTLTYGEELKWLIYIGKGWYIPCKKGTLKYS